MADYDISEAFQRIEEEMIASMSRNLKRHLKTEKEEGLNYTMWQAEQLAALHNFKKDNKKKFSSYFSTINGQIEELIRKANETGLMEQEVAILKAIQKGFKKHNRAGSKSIAGEFFKINDRKLNALIKATKHDMKKGETAMLRRANDEYRKIIYNAGVYYNTGVGTLAQSVDMATKDFLSRGISCIEYANGARVGIDTYARMALRTAQTRAYLLGEATKRDEWGVNTVIVNKRGVACPLCLKYVGKVFYDDVWGNSPIPSPAQYPLLSKAIEGGLYHPNCKDIHTTYFEGISTPPEPMTEAEKKEAARVYNLEQQQRYNERQIRKYKRLSDGSVDPENRDRYYKKLSEWQETQKKFVKANGDVLKRRYENEKIHGIGPIDNADTRRTVAQMRREVALEKLQASKIKDLTNAGNSDIMQMGAVTGAYNNKNDPDGTKRDAHAKAYYTAMRNSNKEPIVSAIAKNTGIETESVSKMYDHLLINKYDLDKGYTTFDEDYDISQSIQRLREGKNIQEHDRVLILHEALEYDLMNNEGLTYTEAHKIANGKYNYKIALDEWLDKNER